MEIEANISPPAIRIQQKIQKYALRVTSFENTSPIRSRTPISFPPEFPSGFDMESMNRNKYKDWFERDVKKSYPTQLIRNLASLNQILETDSNITIQPYLRPYPPWQPTPLNLQNQLAEANKEGQALRVHTHLYTRTYPSLYACIPIYARRTAPLIELACTETNPIRYKSFFSRSNAK